MTDKEQADNNGVEIPETNEYGLVPVDESKMPKIAITYKKISDLSPYENNYNTHSEEQLIRIAESISEMSFLVPILVQDGIVIAGHARLEACKMLEMKEIATVEVEHLSEAQFKAYVIMDNQLANLAIVDKDMLQAEAINLQEMGFEMQLLGFTDGQLNKILDQTIQIPDNFKNVDEEDMEKVCPKCGYEFD